MNNEELKNKIDSVNELLMQSNLLYMVSLDKLNDEDKIIFINEYIVRLVSCISVTLIPPSIDNKIETKVAPIRHALFNSIIKNINQELSNLAALVNLDEISTSVH